MKRQMNTFGNVTKTDISFAGSQWQRKYGDLTTRFRGIAANRGRFKEVNCNESNKKALNLKQIILIFCITNNFLENL